MADYYPIVSRAIAQLQDVSEDARMGVYTRARNAQAKHLESSEPPLSEEDLQAELKALEKAILDVEFEIRSKSSGVQSSDHWSAEHSVPAPVGKIDPGLREPNDFESGLKAVDGHNASAFDEEDPDSNWKSRAMKIAVGAICLVILSICLNFVNNFLNYSLNRQPVLVRPWEPVDTGGGNDDD